MFRNYQDAHSRDSMKIGHTNCIWTNWKQLIKMHIRAQFHRSLCSGLTEAENALNEDP